MRKLSNYLILLLLLIFSSNANDVAQFKTTKEHEVFKQFNGKWKVLVNSYNLVGELVSNYSGKADIHTSLKDRYLDFDFDFANTQTDYEMHWQFGYDKNADKYVLFQRNNLFSYPYYGTGSYDPEKNRFEFLTNDYDKRGNKLRVIIRWERDDKFLLELHNVTIKKAERLIEEYTLVKLDS